MTTTDTTTEISITVPEREAREKLERESFAKWITRQAESL